MRTYLVTGGAGFIGSNYIHYMFGKYGDTIKIINVDLLTYAGNLENLKDLEGNANYTFIKADICDSDAIGQIFAQNDIDRVVHFAMELIRKIRNFCMFPRTRCTALWKKTADISMRRRLTHRTARIRRARQVPTCW